MKEEFSPLRALDRPLGLVPLDEAVDVAYLELHLRLAVPAVLLALQEMVEETLLQEAAVVRVEMGPVLDAVRFQPLLLRGGANESLEVAARMQPLSAPVGGGQERRDDLLPDRRAVAVILIVQRVSEDVIAEVAAVLREFGIRQGLVAAHRLTGDARARAAPAQPVLDRLHLHVVPVGEERAEDAAVVRHVAVPVGRALPDAHGREVRRLERRDVPLVHAVIGDAVQADLAAGPRLHARPLDAVVEILRFPRREVVYIAGRAAGAA